MLKAAYKVANVVDGLAFDRSTHHGRRALANGATLPADFDIAHYAVGNVDVDLDFVATQRVVSFCFSSRWGKLTAVARGPVVVENDLAVEVF